MAKINISVIMLHPTASADAAAGVDGDVRHCQVSWTMCDCLCTSLNTMDISFFCIRM